MLRRLSSIKTFSVALVLLIASAFLAINTVAWRTGGGARGLQSPSWGKRSFPTQQPQQYGVSLPQKLQRWRLGRIYQASSHFTSFTNLFDRNSPGNSTVPLAYELRMLELESRVLKLEGMNNRGAKSNQRTNRRDTQAINDPNNVLPQGEQLLLGCTFAGAMLGLLAGRALIRPHMYLGCIGGAVMGVHFSNKANNFGAAIRALGKLILYACDRLAYAWSEFKFNWKAWRVYERSFKKLETLDKEMQVSAKLKELDRQYQVSDNVNLWWKKFQTGAKEIEANLREQAVYWQRAQRLREEQQQASIIQQEIQRQQMKEQRRAQAAVAAAGVGHGGGGSVVVGPEPAPATRTQVAGGGFQAVVGDGRWGDNPPLHGPSHHPHSGSPESTSTTTSPPSPADVGAARAATPRMSLSSEEALVLPSAGIGDPIMGSSSSSGSGSSSSSGTDSNMGGGSISRSLNIGGEIGRLMQQFQGKSRKRSSGLSSSKPTSSPAIAAAATAKERSPSPPPPSTATPSSRLNVNSPSSTIISSYPDIMTSASFPSSTSSSSSSYSPPSSPSASTTNHNEIGGTGGGSQMMYW